MTPAEKVRAADRIAGFAAKDVCKRTEDARERKQIVEMVVRQLVENHDRVEWLAERAAR